VLLLLIAQSTGLRDIITIHTFRRDYRRNDQAIDDPDGNDALAGTVRIKDMLPPQNEHANSHANSQGSLPFSVSRPPLPCKDLYPLFQLSPSLTFLPWTSFS
jgi:hypothetical protein